MGRPEGDDIQQDQRRQPREHKRGQPGQHANRAVQSNEQPVVSIAAHRDYNECGMAQPDQAVDANTSMI